MRVSVPQYLYCFPIRNALERTAFGLSLRNQSGKCSQRYASSQAQQSAVTVFSGIQPTGVPHLGNYLGALREWVRIQNTAAKDSKLIFSIVDLHALTAPQKSCHLRSLRKETLATLIAVGLDPNRSTIFYQSAVSNSPVADYAASALETQLTSLQVHHHAELFWVLSTVASTGYLSRMTQWKVS